MAQIYPRPKHRPQKSVLSALKPSSRRRSKAPTVCGSRSILRTSPASHLLDGQGQLDRIQYDILIQPNDGQPELRFQQAITPRIIVLAGLDLVPIVAIGFNDKTKLG